MRKMSRSRQASALGPSLVLGAARLWSRDALGRAIFAQL